MPYWGHYCSRFPDLADDERHRSIWFPFPGWKCVRCSADSHAHCPPPRCRRSGLAGCDFSQSFTAVLRGCRHDFLWTHLSPALNWPGWAWPSDLSRRAGPLEKSAGQLELSEAGRTQRDVFQYEIFRSRLQRDFFFSWRIVGY